MKYAILKMAESSTKLSIDLLWTRQNNSAEASVEKRRIGGEHSCVLKIAFFTFCSCSINPQLLSGYMTCLLFGKLNLWRPLIWIFPFFKAVFLLNAYVWVKHQCVCHMVQTWPRTWTYVDCACSWCDKHTKGDQGLPWINVVLNLQNGLKWTLLH